MEDNGIVDFIVMLLFAGITIFLTSKNIRVYRKYLMTYTLISSIVLMIIGIYVFIDNDEVIINHLPLSQITILLFLTGLMHVDNKYEKWMVNNKVNKLNFSARIVKIMIYFLLIISIILQFYYYRYFVI